MSKFMNDAIIGNDGALASLSKTGELLRLTFPKARNIQFIDKFYMGFKVNDSRCIYLHDDVNNTYKQSYIDKTNILKTEIFNSYFNLRIIQTDFMLNDKNLLIRKFKFINENENELNIDFLAYSKLTPVNGNDFNGFFNCDTLMQYNHDYTICTFSSKRPKSYIINNSKESFDSGFLFGKDYIGMSNDSAISYEIGTLHPNEEAEFSLMVYLNDNEKCKTNDIYLDEFKKLDVDEALKSVKTCQEEALNSCTLDLKDKNLDKKIINIFNRSILLFKLLVSNDTGGILSAMEVDEKKEKCGKYAYCWPRDGAYITEAFDILNMYKETFKFYRDFLNITQSKDGKWEQRFYLDGMLAPSWGYQVDEVSSVILGVYNHYQRVHDKDFLIETYKMCENAISFLQTYIDDIINGKGEMQKSYDLWEEYEGESLYSIASIYSAFNCMIKINDEIKDDLNRKLDFEERNKFYSKECDIIKEYLVKMFYDEEKGSFVRNTTDKRIDISILGIVYPFKVFDAKDEKVVNTVSKMENALRTPSGGYLRYEGDNYMGGNPWVISSLWMSLYDIELGEIESAKRNFKYAVDTSTENGFLAEQIDDKTLDSKWVIGLAWSHAMFIIVLEKLKGELN